MLRIEFLRLLLDILWILLSRMISVRSGLLARMWWCWEAGGLWWISRRQLLETASLEWWLRRHMWTKRSRRRRHMWTRWQMLIDWRWMMRALRMSCTRWTIGKALWWIMTREVISGWWDLLIRRVDVVIVVGWKIFEIVWLNILSWWSWCKGSFIRKLLLRLWL